MDTTAFLVLAAALLSVVVGLAKLGAWLIDRREADRARVIREASIVAQASAEARR